MGKIGGYVDSMSWWEAIWLDRIAAWRESLVQAVLASWKNRVKN